jgi:hypothetical protein
MYKHLRRQLLAAIALPVLLSAPALAQTTDDGGPDPATIRVRIGPLWMNPTIALPNVGVDTNVFNDPPEREPKQDFTMTVSPKADLWLRMGRTWLSGSITEDVVWYQKYTTERSANHLFNVAWKAPLNRVVLSTGATWIRTKARPGFEIDARVRRREPAYAASAEVRSFARTFIGARGSWRKVAYEDVEFLGNNLRDELDRTTTSAAITVRHELTPLTSVTFGAGRTEQRFRSAARNSASDDYTVSFSFDPAALLKGSVTFGYTNYRPESADLPGYRGSTVDVTLAYELLSATRFTGTINRAVEFSFDNDQPYYLLTGGSLSIAQRIVGPFDLVGRATAQNLNYRSRVGDLYPVQPERTDSLRSFGSGLGYRMGQDVRLGFNVDRERRTSILPERGYKTMRYGVSLTYGQ